MSKSKVIAQIFAVVAIFIVATSCVGQQAAGIPPAEATIWALNTQLAVQETAAASTLTAVSNDSVPAQDAQPQQPVEEVAVVLPAATPEPFSLAIDPVMAAAEVTVNCTIKATNVEARTGPDVRFTFAGHHVAGEPCVITARYYDWFYVTFPSNNSKGWLYLEWLNISDLASLASIPQIAVNTDWVWMRACKKYCR